MKDNLFGNLRGDAPQSFGGLEEADLAANLGIGVDLARIFQRDFQLRIFDIVIGRKNAFDRVDPDTSAVLVELAPQILLALVFFASSGNNGIFHRAHHNLRIDSFFAA